MILGLLGGPLIMYGLGTLIVLFREHRAQKTIDRMRREHNVKIESIKKDYDKKRKKFNRQMNKIQKIIAKARKKEEKE